MEWFCPTVAFGNVWRSYLLLRLVGGNATGIHGVEAKGAAKYPAVTMTAVPQPSHQQKKSSSSKFQ